MARRIGLFLLALLGLLIVAAAGLAVFRAPIGEALLTSRLEARGVPAPRLSLRELGPGHLEIAELRLGAREELTARRLRVTYSLAGLLEGRLDKVEIEGLELQLDATGTGPPLGSLQPLLAGTGDQSAGAAMPLVSFEDARVIAVTPLGAIVAALDGELRPGDRGALDAALKVRLEGESGRLSGTLGLALTPEKALSGTLTVDDGTLSLPGAEAHGLAGEITFASEDGLPTSIEGRLSLKDLDLPGAAFEAAELNLKASEAQVEADARLVAADGRWRLDLQGQLRDYLSESPMGRLEVRASAEAGAGLWPLLALPGPETGKARGHLRIVGTLPPLDDLTDGAGPALEALLKGKLRAVLTLDAEALSYPGRMEGLSGRLPLEAKLAGGAVTVTLPADARIDAERLSPAWLADLGLPLELVPLLSGGATLLVQGGGEDSSEATLLRDESGTDVTSRLRLSLMARGGAALQAETNAQLRFEPGMTLTAIALEELRLTASNIELAGADLTSLTVTGNLGGESDRLLGDLDISLDLAGFTLAPLGLGKTRLSLPASFVWTPSAASARLRAAGSVEIEELAIGDRVASDGPLRARIASAEVDLDRAGGGYSIFHRLELAVEELGLSLTRGDGDPLRVRGDLPNLHLEGTYATGQAYRGLAEIAGARVRLPDYGVTFEQLATNLSLDDTGDAVVLDATAQGPGGAGRIALQGRHSLSDGRGDLDIELHLLSFAPGALQPGALAPALAALRAVTGTARADARLSWAPDRLDGEAHLVLEEFSFDSDDADVEGLNLELGLDRLFPPGSPPGQRLTVRRIDLGVPIENLTLSYRLQPGPPPRLVIQEGEFEWSGGRFFVQDLVLDPKSERHDATIQVENLDLAELFAALNIDGLQGSGRISGALPFTIEDEAVTIRDAQLDAQEPGVIRYRSEQAEQVLAGGGDSTELMLRALENFHYDQLSLGIAKTADDKLRVKATLMGKNPDLMEGYPFRFNINLETDAGKLLAALSQFYSLSDRVLRRAGIFAR